VVIDRKEAIAHALKIAKGGDVIVLAGKGHEDYQIFENNRHIHFDEREVVAEALKNLD
jgi:UDP-N-acetylmuramoyl-L-alanyl-D-glutamate--2,6-diaminopimelate ligase